MKTYHHGNLREALIDAAASAIVEQPAEALSLRALARSAGVSQTAPYRHFIDRNSLLAALSQRGYIELLERLRATESVIGTELKIRSAARAYVQFAVANPQLFKLMFGPLLQPTDQFPELHALVRDCNQWVQRTLAEGINSDLSRQEDLRYLTNTAWAGIHGLAILVIDMPALFERHIELDKQMDSSVRALLMCLGH